MAKETTLEDYLNGNAYNISIHQILEENYNGLFDHLEFFNLLYNAFDFFEDNQDNYLVVKNRYNQLNLKGLQRCVFLFYLVETIKHFHQKPDGRFYFTDAAAKSFGYISDLLNSITKELFPDEEPEAIEESQSSTSTTASLIPEKPNTDILDEEETPTSNATLRQKILVIKYLQQFNLLKLTTIHQDQTKQAQILSFLMGPVSANTTRVALGEDISVLKTKKNLEAAQKLFEPLKDAFPQIVSQIEDDIKHLKK